MTTTNFELLLAPHDGFPWFRHFQTSEREAVQIEYKSNIENKCLVFKAEVIRENGKRHPVIVKFTPTYSTAAHIVCEQAKCAPALLHESQVPCSIATIQLCVLTHPTGLSL